MFKNSLLTFLFCTLPLHLNAGENFLPQNFHVQILQEYESALPGGAKRTSEGSISYQYPGNIRFEIDAPDQIILVSNGKKTWYYTAAAFEGEPGELHISPAQNTGLSSFFDALKHGLQDNLSYTVQLTSKQASLSFVEKMAEEIDIKKALIKFKNKNKSFQDISRVELTYLDGHQTAFEFKNIKTSKTFKADTFKFEAPQNTRTHSSF